MCKKHEKKILCYTKNNGVIIKICGDLNNHVKCSVHKKSLQVEHGSTILKCRIKTMHQLSIKKAIEFLPIYLLILVWMVINNMSLYGFGVILMMFNVIIDLVLLVVLIITIHHDVYDHFYACISF